MVTFDWHQVILIGNVVNTASTIWVHPKLGPTARKFISAPDHILHRFISEVHFEFGKVGSSLAKLHPQAQLLLDLLVGDLQVLVLG